MTDLPLVLVFPRPAAFFVYLVAIKYPAISSNILQTTVEYRQAIGYNAPLMYHELYRTLVNETNHST
jgi:hypothetical protein